ncbi:DNA photolyase, FAD-binding/Cryptochrome [Nitzschia inconspicua]|uniref:DNA photolyase, FAD-binding/Cryptochrome n=1 Tax=Nitzschia inconspicua TaxID=303405 RepID=A0A9K3PR16_9STRA|nr:DNA photolyase, FAD-binding/Cryptochrome [Nitzschia inconspicua]
MRDLRLHDNPLYHVGDDTSVDPVQCFPVFIFDDHDFAPRPSTCRPQHWNAVHLGPHACRVLLESVQDLQQSLRHRGGDLFLRTGSTVPVILQLLQDTQATEIVWNEELGIYEQERSQQVLDAITANFPHVTVHTFCDSTLYHPDDLPHGAEEWERYAHPERSKQSKKKQNKKQGKTAKSSGNHLFDRHETPGKSSKNNLVDLAPTRFEGIPPIMGDFRRAARDKAQVRSCLDTPSSRIDYGTMKNYEMPTLENLLRPLLCLSDDDNLIMGLPHSLIRQVCHHAIQQHDTDCKDNLYQGIAHGGETRGLQHLQDFCHHHAATAQRNLACVDNHQSSRLSHYLTFGCLSPRKIVKESELQNQQTNAGDCNWLISHMTMRDFFLYTCLATGKAFYLRDGIPVNKKAAKMIVWKDWQNESVQLWHQWATGQTGLPLIDAGLRELTQTGYCSNRVRQNAASVLTKDLGVDWRAGAEWFQFLLIDHCVGANWGNWLYFSGKGSDPKHRHFRTVSQALKYDKDGVYVKMWLPELRELVLSFDSEAYLRPWDFSKEATRWKIPIVPPESQYTLPDLERLRAEGRLINS